MRLPSFKYVSQRSQLPKQMYWGILHENIVFTGYTTDDGQARDIMVHFEAFAIIANAAGTSCTNGIII